MSHNPAATRLFHITDVSNLSAVLAASCLLSDVALAGGAHQVIGYGHIKQRRMTQYRVPCCGNRFVGEFVPFYFCPRSPMLFTVNRGATGRTPGCQKDIVHMVMIACHNGAAARRVAELLATANYRPAIEVQPGWYY